MVRLRNKVFRHGSWRSRGYLPHFDRGGLTQQITFRLSDSLPPRMLGRWRRETAELPKTARRQALDERVAACLDRGLGECHLRDGRVAAMVEKTLLHFDGERYRMLAWCIMPNHVHAVAEIFASHSLESILHSWKSFSSKQANRILKRTGRFWQADYHDRYVRDEAHLLAALEYVEHNPVSAGLVERPEDWRWSSAWHREQRSHRSP